MRTTFTGDDLKQYIEYLFNGNFSAYKASNGSIEYNNPNSEQIVLIDAENGSQTDYDLAQYLNIEFYTWKDRLVEKSSQGIDSSSPLHYFEDWVQSLNFSLKESYALVEKLDEEVVASQDIDSATITGRITFLVQSDKVVNLDYYVSKLRNTYLGQPQTIQNSYGDEIKAFLTLGTLVYEQEPMMTQVGECIVVSSNFRLTYLNDAQVMSDTKIEISLDGDDLYDAQGNIVDENGNATTTKYLEMPITKSTSQRVFNTTPLPTYTRPDMTGYVSSSVANVDVLSFYDYNKPLTKRFNELFWTYGAFRIDNALTTTQNVNIPVWLKITSEGHVYYYKKVIEQMEKVLTNNDFNICSISLKGYGKF